MKPITLILLLTTLSINNLQSQNIIGGEITYSFPSEFMLETHVTIYALDDTLLIASVEYGDGGVNLLYMNGEDIGGGIYKYTDSALHILNGIGLYLITCSSGKLIPDIVNVADSETKDFYMQMFVNIYDGFNTAPVFLSPINDFSTMDFCTVIHSEDAYDSEGDSLAYSLNEFKVDVPEPYDGYIPWASDTIYIDPYSGLFHWESPPEAGLYGLSFLTSEYRDGVLLGTSERKFVTNADCFVSSISNPEQNAELLIYPNPASDFISIQSNMYPAQIHIYNLQGKELISSDATSASNALDISKLPCDLYLVVVKNANGNTMAFSKFIKVL